MESIGRTRMWVGVASGVALLVGAAGCDSANVHYVNKLCECLSCGEQERRDLIGLMENRRQIAANAGCAEEFNASLACADALVTCEARVNELPACETVPDPHSPCGPVLAFPECELLCERSQNCGGVEPTDCRLACWDQLLETLDNGCTAEYDGVLLCLGMLNDICLAEGCDAEWEVYVTCREAS